MIEEAADWRPVAVPDWVRSAVATGGIVLLILALVPPVSSEARRYEYVEAIQFALLAFVVPAFLTLGAPWRLLGLARALPRADDHPGGTPQGRRRLFDRLGEARRRHLGFARTLGFVLLEMVVVVMWRVPVAVDALARHGWLAAVEGGCALVGGIGLWSELVDSPPLSPRATGPRLALSAALVMWTIWISAYVLGLSQGPVYPAYRHVAGVGLSLAADQEIATFVLWFVATAVFMPVIFSSLTVWLRTEEDPDQAMYRLLRETRRQALTRPPGTDRPADGGETKQAG